MLDVVDVFVVEVDVSVLEVDVSVLEVDVSVLEVDVSVLEDDVAVVEVLVDVVVVGVIGSSSPHSPAVKSMNAKTSPVKNLRCRIHRPLVRAIA